MPIKRLSQTSLASFQKHSNLLAGNQAFNPGSFDHLETVTLGSPASTVTFSNLNTYSSYTHLQVRLVARMSAGTTTGVLMDFNSTTSSHRGTWMRGNGSGGMLSADLGTSSYFIGVVPGDSADANNFGFVIADILNFNSTSKTKSSRGFSGVNQSGNSRIIMHSVGYFQTTALTSLRFTGETGASFLANSSFSLYGIKG